MNHGNRAMVSSKAWWSPSSILLPSSLRWSAHNCDDSGDDVSDEDGVDPAPDLPLNNLNCLLFAVTEPLNLCQWQCSFLFVVGANVHSYLWHLEVKEVESQCAKFFYYGSRFVDYIVCRYKGSLHWHQCHPNPHLVDTFAKDRVPSRDLPRCWGCPENLNLPCSPFNLQCHLLFRFGETPFSWAASRSLVTWTKVCQLLSKPALTLYNLLHNASDIMACRDHCQKMAAKKKKEIKK